MSDDRQSLEQMLQDGLPPAPAIGERVLWDDEVRGLGLRLRQGMSPTWIYRRRGEGRLVKRTLAQADAMSLDQARAAAVALGNTETTGRVEVSLHEFAATFMRDCAGRWKPATIDNHRRDLRRLILPTLGDIAVDKLGKADVTIWLDQLDISGRTKDRATSVLSSMMRHAETLGPSSVGLQSVRRPKAASVDIQRALSRRPRFCAGSPWRSIRRPRPIPSRSNPILSVLLMKSA